jgi:hypothetical protein
VLCFDALCKVKSPRVKPEGDERWAGKQWGFRTPS